MKKFLALLLALVMVFALAACGEAEPSAASDAPASEAPEASDAPASEAPEVAGIPLDEIKVGFIFLHDENSTYDLNFINAAKAACEALGLTEDQYVLQAPTSPRARSATTPPPSWLTTAATSSLPTASATRTS